MSESGTRSTSGSSCGGSSSGAFGPGIPGSWVTSASALIGDLSALDHDRLAVARRDAEPSVAVDHLCGAASAVDADAAAAEEVARAQVGVDRGEPAGKPGRVAALEVGEQHCQERRARPLAAGREVQGAGRRAGRLRELLASKVDA